ncbi:hypothetical protein [Sediminibacterium sp.]|uniref:hypothetical protein n=1 Tax=Sediminibacterium sp. TaxID=1917865 RepID=UPI003F6A3F2A
METITLEKVLETMDAGKRFSIGIRTYDHRKEKGGEYIFIEEAVKHNYKLPSERNAMAKSEERNSSILRNPNHYDNSTRNIKVMANGNLIKIHIRLIVEFNGCKVL